MPGCPIRGRSRILPQLRDLSAFSSSQCFPCTHDSIASSRRTNYENCDVVGPLPRSSVRESVRTGRV